jgi:hypothetical protein
VLRRPTKKRCTLSVGQLTELIPEGIFRITILGTKRARSELIAVA